MKQIAVILTFPYFAPIMIWMAAAYLRNTLTNSPQSTAAFSGGEVAGYYVLIPVALIIQICFGIPGSLIIWRSASRRVGILSCALMAGLPFVLISPNYGSPQFTLSSLIPIVGIMTFFGVGSCVSFYFLHNKKTKNPNKAQMATPRNPPD